MFKLMGNGAATFLFAANLVEFPLVGANVAADDISTDAFPSLSKNLHQRPSHFKSYRMKSHRLGFRQPKLRGMQSWGPRYKKHLDKKKQLHGEEGIKAIGDTKRSIYLNEEDNKCAGTDLGLANIDCVHLPGPQAGGNVTKGYVGEMEVDVVPNLKNYWQSSMCPVGVHWHIGTEHYSMGEYDENGKGPNGNIGLAPHSDDAEDYEDGQGKGHSTRDEMTDDALYGRNLADHYRRPGFRCHYYDPTDEKFTKPYEWKHCEGMEVGETYEVHWPHSAAGACGTIDQYQSPFYDGLFCNLGGMEAFNKMSPQDVASAIGVQAQIYTVVNDESYFYPDLIRSWMVDNVTDIGMDIAYYTGSTTTPSRSNKICSTYTPVTWQVDRKCHLISASSFDKLCYDMKNQRADMSKDLHAHGSRELVKDSLVANNQARKLENAKEEVDHEKADLTPEQTRHLRIYGHYHSHDDHHHEWY